MTIQGEAPQGQVYYFRASLDGVSYFGGYCTSITSDDDQLTLIDRRVPTSVLLRPGSRIETAAYRLGTLKITKAHYDYFVTTVHRPPWYDKLQHGP